DPPWPAEFDRGCQPLRVPSRRPCHVRPCKGHIAKLIQSIGDPLDIPEHAPDRQALLVQYPGSGVITLIECRSPEVAETIRTALRIAQLSLQLQALLVQCARCRVIALVERHVAQVTQRIGDPLLVREAPPDRQAFANQTGGRRIITLITGQKASTIERPRAGAR